MVISMTNRLLAVVIAIALSSGIVAHAAQAPQRPLAPVSLPSASSLPLAVESTVGRISETATSTVDPSGAIRDAYQRDHVALEHLRQQASQLKGSAHPAFNQLISDDEAALTEIERTALATTRPVADTTIAAMDTLVASAQADLDQALTLGSTSSKSSGHNDQHAASNSGHQAND